MTGDCQLHGIRVEQEEEQMIDDEQIERNKLAAIRGLAG